MELVRKSPLSIQDTLASLGVPRSTYYRWGQPTQAVVARGSWNKLPEEQEQTVLAYAHTGEWLSSCRLWHGRQQAAGHRQHPIGRTVGERGVLSPVSVVGS